MKINKQVVIGAIAICIAAILWGLDGIVLTPRLSRLNIGLVVLVVHLLPFIIMNLLFFREYRHIKDFNPKDILLFLLLSVTGGAIGTMAIVKALFLVNFKALTIVVLLQKLQPVFAILLAYILLKEKLKKNFLLYAVIAIIAGYFLTFGMEIPEFSANSNTLLAAGFSLIAAFSFGSSTVFSKLILQKYHFFTATFYRYGFTSLLMLLWVLFTNNLSGILQIHPNEWLIFSVIGATTGSGAIYLYYFGLTRIRAMLATICELFFPLSAILFDYIFNHHILTPVQWISALIMILAILKLTLNKAE